MIDTFFILFTSSPAQRRAFSDRTLDKSAGLGAARRGR